MNTDGTGRNVLIVDGDPDRARQVADELRRRGFDVSVRRHGVGLVKEVKDRKPAAIVLELVLPDCDGRSVLAQLKDDWDAKKVPVVVTSEYTSRLDYKGREQADAIVPKSAGLGELLLRVEQAASKKQD